MKRELINDTVIISAASGLVVGFTKRHGVVHSQNRRRRCHGRGRCKLRKLEIWVLRLGVRPLRLWRGLVAWMVLNIYGEQMRGAV